VLLALPLVAVAVAVVDADVGALATVDKNQREGLRLAAK
jgi:hypothetical protein